MGCAVRSRLRSLLGILEVAQGYAIISVLLWRVYTTPVTGTVTLISARLTVYTLVSLQCSLFTRFDQILYCSAKEWYGLKLSLYGKRSMGRHSHAPQETFLAFNSQRQPSTSTSGCSSHFSPTLQIKQAHVSIRPPRRGNDPPINAPLLIITE